MQKFLTLIVFSIFVFTANAQFQKGNKVLGAGLNFQTGGSKSSSASDKYTSTGTNISLDLGFATKPNRINGFFLNAGYGKSKYENSPTPSADYASENFNAGAGYFSKMYKPLGKGFFVYAEGRGGLNYLKQNNTNNSNPDYSQYSVNVGLYPGLAYKWNNHFMLDVRFADFASLGYYIRKTQTNSGSDITEYNFSLNSSLGLGYLSNIGIGARWIIK